MEEFLQERNDSGRAITPICDHIAAGLPVVSEFGEIGMHGLLNVRSVQISIHIIITAWVGHNL